MTINKISGLAANDNRMVDKTDIGFDAIPEALAHGAGIADDGGGLAVLEQGSDLFRLHRAAERYENGIGFENGEKANDKFYRVVQIKGYPIPSMDAQLTQAIGQAVGTRVQVGIGIALAAADQSDLIRARCSAVL